MPASSPTSARLQAAETALASIGCRPAGDPAAMLAYAKQLRTEADTVAAAGRADQAVPGALTFQGPAAKRFGFNARQAAEALFAVQRQLDEAARTVEHAAHTIAAGQRDFDRKKDALTQQIRHLEAARP